MIEREKHLGITKAIFATDGGYEDAVVWSQALEPTLDNHRKQAQDKTTPPSVLSKLAKNEDRFVRQYVAINPNTPLKSLEKLGAEFPYEVADNAQTSAEILKQLLASNRTRKRSPILYQKILNHSNSSEEIIHAVVTRCSDSLIRESALNFAKTSAKTLKVIALERNIIDKSDNYQLLIKHPHVSAEIITIAQIVIDHKAITPEVLIEFACRSYGLDTVAKAAFRHQNMSAEILAQLSLSEFELVKVAVVKHPKTTVATLKHLTKDGNEFIRATILKRDRIPQKIVAILEDDHNYCHHSMGLNSHLPLAILWKMLEQNEAAPDLASSPPLTKVRMDIETRNYEPSARLVNFYIKKAIAKHPDTPLDFLLTLIKDEDEEIRAAAASSPKLSATILEQLLNDNSSKVKWAVLDNPSVDSDTLRLYLEKARKDKRRCGREMDTKIANRQLRQRQKTVIYGMANLISWQKSLDPNSLICTCRIINRAWENSNGK